MTLTAPTVSPFTNEPVLDFSNQLNAAAMREAIEQVRAFTNGKNINPQWSPDGKQLYFISDRDGIPNLYRVAVATGDVAQVTNVGTGLSGITSTSPAPERSICRWVPSPQSIRMRSPPRRTSDAGRPRRAVGAEAAVPRKSTLRAIA